MKNILIISICLLVHPLFAQETVSTFHRLLIFNASEELMVVKIKNTDFWVTPGLYSKNINDTDNELYKLAAEYGLTVSKPDLRGSFVLKNNTSDAIYNRHFFNVKVTGGDIQLPANIEEIKWLPINTAMQVITFPHINMLLKQIVDYPTKIWSGTVLRYKEDNQLKARMTTDFFPIERNSKN